MSALPGAVALRFRQGRPGRHLGIPLVLIHDGMRPGGLERRRRRVFANTGRQK